MIIDSKKLCNKVNHALTKSQSELISMLEKQFSCKLQVETLECQLFNPVEYGILVKLKILSSTGLFAHITTGINEIESKLEYNKTLDRYGAYLQLGFETDGGEPVFCGLVSPKNLMLLYLLYYPDKNIWELESEPALEKQGYFNQYRRS